MSSARQRVPIVGMKPPPRGNRPACKGCARELEPSYMLLERRVAKATGFGYEYVGKEWTGGYKGYSGFHTQRCAIAFALEAYAAGYRRKGRE